MEPIGKLGFNDTSNILMLPIASKFISIIFSDRCIHILNNKEMLNRLICSTKMKKRESIFKYKLRIYNFLRNYDVNHRGIKIRRNNKTLP